MGRQVNDEIDTVNKGWRVDDDGWRGSPQDNDEGRNRLLTSAAVGRRASMRATTCCRRGPLQDNDDVVSTIEGGASLGVKSTMSLVKKFPQSSRTPTVGGIIIDN